MTAGRRADAVADGAFEEALGEAGVAKEVTEPVTVADNGVRSLAPPTFCFDLRGGDGALVEAVSRVVFGALEDFDAVAALPTGRPAALGRIADYDAGPQAQVPGRQFLIDRVLPVSS